MKTVNKISCFEYGLLVYFIIRSMSLGISINSYIHVGGLDGYLSPLIGMIIGFIPLYIFIKIVNFKPDLNIFEKINYKFGKKMGLVINIIFIGSTLFLVTIVFWNLLNFISSQYLFRTSNLYVSIIFGICFVYTCTKDLNVTARVSNMLFYISAIIFFICIIGLIGNINLNNLKPFLENGLKNPILSGFAHVSYSILPLFILTLIPKSNIKNNDKLTKYIIIFYLIANLSKFIVIFITLSTFGIELAKLYEFPDFILLRRIATTGFFQRYESILATQWIFDLYIMISICFQFIKYSYQNLTNNKNKNLFISIVIFITCIICSNFLFNNNTHSNNFILYIFPFIQIILFFIIPLIIYLKNKKKST